MSSKEWKKPPESILSLFSLHQSNKQLEEKEPPDGISSLQPSGDVPFRVEYFLSSEAERQSVPFKEPSIGGRKQKPHCLSPPSRIRIETSIQQIQSMRKIIIQLQQQIDSMEEALLTVCRENNASTGCLSSSSRGLPESAKQKKPPRLDKKNATNSQPKKKKGFANQSNAVSLDLHEFLTSNGFKSTSADEDKNNNICYARTWVIQCIHTYIKSHSLQNAENKTTFLPDEALATLFQQNGPIRYFDVPRLLSAHFTK